MPRNKSKKFLQKKYAQAHKKASAQQPKSVKQKLKETREKISAIQQSSSTLKQSDLSSLGSMVKGGSLSRQWSDSSAMLDSDDDRSVGGLSDALSDLSILSEITIFDDDSTVTNPMERQAAFDEFSEHFDQITSRDLTSRLEGFQCVNHAMCRRMFDDYLHERNDERLDAMTYSLTQSLRKGVEGEVMLALKCVTLTAVTLQSGVSHMFERLKGTLEKLVTDHTKEVSLLTRSTALITISTMVWCSTDDHMALEVMNFLEKIWKFSDNCVDDDSGIPHELHEHSTEEEEEKHENEHKRFNVTLRASALKCWTWLLCCAPKEGIASLFDVYYNDLKLVLETSQYTDLRCAVGEALAVLVTSVKRTLADSELAEFVEENDLENEFVEEHMEEVVVIMEEMRDEAGKKTRQTELRKQRHKFREYLQTIEDSGRANDEGTPAVKVKLRQCSFDLKEWPLWVQYHRFKEVMTQGLQVHLMCNAKIQRFFHIGDIAYKSTSGMSTTDKIVKKNEFNRATKKRQKGRRRDRDSKWAGH